MHSNALTLQKKRLDDVCANAGAHSPLLASACKLEKTLGVARGSYLSGYVASGGINANLRRY